MLRSWDDHEVSLSSTGPVHLKNNNTALLGKKAHTHMHIPTSTHSQDSMSRHNLQGLQ